MTDGLVAVQTLLGWTVMGSWSISESASKQIDSYGVLVNQTEQTPDLWSLEVLGITDPYQVETKEENEVAAIEHFKDTVKINDDCKYI